MRAITDSTAVHGTHATSSTVITSAGGLTMAMLKEKVRRPSRLLDQRAACRATDSLVAANDWTPEYEEEQVPARLRAVCAACPVWQDCLSEALRMNDIGYRASMTTRQRRHYFAEIVASVRPMTHKVTVPARTRSLGDPDRTPTHPVGDGSLNSYRRGCRCDECRGHNAAARRRERAKAS